MKSIRVLKDFERLSREELDALYANGRTDHVPSGQCRGRALFCAGTYWTSPLAIASIPFWQGKVFVPEENKIINRVLGFRLVPASLAVSSSSMDGKPAITIDYANKSPLFSRIRDEIRELSPGIYLGKAYFRTRARPVFFMDFALDFRR